MKDEAKFRHRLHKLITLEGLSFEEFAAKVNKSERNVRRYVAEGITPMADVIEKICEVFPHWSQEYLLANRGPLIIDPSQDKGPQYDTYSKISYWLNIKSRMQKALALLPAEAHQELHKVGQQEVKELLQDLEALMQSYHQTIHP